CRRLRWLSDMIEDATFLPVPSRIAKRLVHLAETHGEREGSGVRIALKLPQRTIGELAGVSRETTNKHLRQWSDLGWVSLGRQTVTILDMPALQEVAEGESGDLV